MAYKVKLSIEINIFEEEDPTHREEIKANAYEQANVLIDSGHREGALHVRIMDGEVEVDYTGWWKFVETIVD